MMRFSLRLPVSLLTLASLLLLSFSLHADETLTSPEGEYTLTFRTGDSGELLYRVEWRKWTILTDSRLGMELENGPSLTKGFHVVDVEREAHSGTWEPVYGEQSVVPENYRQMKVHLENEQSPPQKLILTFRAYPEGVAFCYTLPETPGRDEYAIASERTEFTFEGDPTCWPVYSAQGEYHRATISQVQGNCERPLLVQFPDGPSVSIGEARLVDFSRMRLRPGSFSGPERHSLRAHLAGPAVVKAPYTTPWRFVMAAPRPGALVENNYLLLNLNAPCAIEDTSWIRPGKVIREVTLTTQGGKDCIDFAVERGLQYIEFDAGWYGHEYDDASDATTVTKDTQKAGNQAPLDIEEVVRYGQQRGIGVIVYVNRRQLERQLDEILPLYQKWGIRGVKYGFVQVGSQEWTTWLHEAVRKAARHRLLVDIHDEYRPTGYERTYPNLMTQEGIRGNECMPTATHNTVLALTRTLCGAGDYTHCWYTRRIQTTHAHQLASAVVFYSPLQFLFWYDRPSMYRGEPELDFWKILPTTWDRSLVLHDDPGRQVTFARRRSDAWFVGILNNDTRKKIHLALDFLPPGKTYRATLHRDAFPDGREPFAVTTERMTVDAETELEIETAPAGGAALHLAPVR
jgi:alpha-glucosidase